MNILEILAVFSGSVNSSHYLHPHVSAQEIDDALIRLGARFTSAKTYPNDESSTATTFKINIQKDGCSVDVCIFSV